MQQDSLIVAQQATAAPDSMPQKPARPQTPYQVLRLLPKDATPAQQDSAIQAWFQPGEVHYSSQPDTLHLPGHGKGRNLKEVNLPQYYRESFFSNDTLLHPELNGGRFGVAGDPLPYVIGNNNLVSSLLIACFVVSMLAYSASKSFVLRQLRDFFNLLKLEQLQEMTAGEVRSMLFFTFQTSLLLSLLYFFYVQEYVADTFILSEEHYLIGLIFLVCTGYFVLRALLYTIADLTFFDGKKNKQWMQALFLLTAVEGVLLYPAVLLVSYFDIDPESIMYFCVFVVVFVKILTFYKCFVIFFRQNGFYLQIFLYFCALEIVPVFALWGGLEVMMNALKINF